MSDLYDAICSEINERKYIENMIDDLEFQPISFPISFTRLDKSCKLLREGALTVIGAPPGAGKSILANSLLVDCLKNNIMCRYLPLESDKKFYLRRIACILNKNWDALSEDANVAKFAMNAVKDTLEKISPMIVENPALPDINDYCRNLTPEYILNWCEKQYKKNVKVLIIDPLALIDFKSSGRYQYQTENEFIQKAVTLAQRYNACFVLVVHTVKRYDFKIPDMSDIQGGAALSRLASSIIILHNHDFESKRRLGSNVFTNNGHTKQVDFNKIIHVAKARNSEGSGVKIAFDFKDAYFREIGFFAPKSQLRPEPTGDNYKPYKD